MAHPRGLTAAETTPAVECVNLSRAAKDLGVSASSASHYVEQGELATVEVAWRRAIERTALDAFTSTRTNLRRTLHWTVRRTIARDMALNDESRTQLFALLDEMVS